MKFIHVTDPHLVSRGKLLHGLDPYERFRQCVADINKYHRDSELCVITGDLAHSGSIDAYQGLKECLLNLEIPAYLLIGNHDHRDQMLGVFQEQPIDKNGFLQHSVDTSAGKFLFLDTVEETKPWGAYCRKRLSWLNESLKNSLNTQVYIFMHHPPFNVDLQCIDRLGLGRDGDQIGRVLSKHDNIRHIFFGHIHRPVTGSWLGIPYSTLRGTSHQVPLDFEATDIVPKSHEPPAYAVVFLSKDQTTVHFHDYLDTSRVAYNKKSEGRPDYK